MYIKICSITFLLTTLFLSCNTNSKQKESAYIGGEIINPNNNYITIFTRQAEPDTIYLDANNRFIYKIENLETGLYSFTHGGEYQSLLIEPNDSILFRLNTNDFDESLVYTGIGANKNNFLIKTYLNDEVENKRIIDHHQLEPEDFENYISNLKKQKLENLERFEANQHTSELFNKIAIAGIDYNYYSSKEMYPFGYYGNNRLIHFKDLPEGYYDFRNNVDYDDIELSGLSAYTRFMYWHFSNLALKEYYNDGSHYAFDRHSLNYNLEKLRLVDTTISNETIKNFVLTQVTKDFIFNSKNAKESNEILASFLDKNSDVSGKNYMTNLVESSISLHPGNKIPNIEIIDYQSNVLDLSSIIHKPTVIYCWSSNFKMHYRNSHFMMKNLKTQYPDMDFIAININDFNSKSWKKTLNLLKFPTENEYLFKTPNEAVKRFAIAHSHKVIIVDKNGIIIQSDANLFSKEINTDIKTVLALN